MSHLYQSAFMEALGWSLVDSFWKMGCLWLVYHAITVGGKLFSASFRYALAALLAGGGTLWTLATIPHYYRQILAGHPLSIFSSYLKDAVNTVRGVDQVMIVLSFLYIITVATLSARLLIQYRSKKKTLLDSLVAPDNIFISLLHDLIARMGLKRNISLWLTASGGSPLTIGFLKPLILIPVAALNQLNVSEAEAIIAHELVHIRRQDYLINLLLSFSELILFFNPFARLFSATIHKERENACDDEVIALGFDQWQYAHALYTLGKNCTGSPDIGIAAIGNHNLLDRVARIMHVKSRRVPLAEFVKTGFLLILCFAVGVFVRKPVARLADIPDTGKMVLSVPPPLTVLVIKEPQETAVFVSRETTITKTVTVIKRPVRTTRQSRPEVPRPPAPPVPADLTTFVSIDSKPLEFSYYESVAPAAALPVNDGSEKSPYLPRSTFFYPPSADSLSKAGGKTVHL